ncbi:unnamed protein product [Mycena citricolor]|uniref:FAD-binding PCMH-type domain-containing protein n=1 Tax=Mycena citricolor TaxID=2018698 RepID=A0AAD2HF68_9AGAR|nr:unnamed protein product [Mycena citricolor]
MKLRLLPLLSLLSFFLPPHVQASLAPRVSVHPSQRVSSLQTCLSTAFALNPHDVSFPQELFYQFLYVKPYNTRIHVVPAAVTRPTTSAQVAQIVKCAVASSVKVQARSGGHSYGNYGIGGQDGAVVVDLVNFKQFAMNSTTWCATIGAGMLLEEVTSKLHEAGGRAIAHGTCPQVGIGGHATIGGLGPLSRQWGATLDHVLEVEVVLANGTITRANSTHNPDLLFAVKGAAASFGIVTEFVFLTHAEPSSAVIYSYRLQLGSHAAHASTFALWQSIIAEPELDRRLASEIIIFELGMIISGTYFGSRDQYNALDLERRLGQNATVTVTVLNDWLGTVGNWAENEALKLVGGIPGPFYSKSLTFKASTLIPVPGIQDLFNYFDTASKGTLIWFAIFDLEGGAVNDVPQNSTAYAHRDVQFYMQTYAVGIGSISNTTTAFVEGISNTIIRSMPGVAFGAYAGYVEYAIVHSYRTAKKLTGAQTSLACRVSKRLSTLAICSTIHKVSNRRLADRDSREIWLELLKSKMPGQTVVIPVNKSFPFAFLSKPPQRTRPVAPIQVLLPEAPFEETVTVQVTRRRSNSAIIAWAAAVQPGSPSSPRRRGSINGRRSPSRRRGSTSSSRRPSISGRQGTTSYIVIKTPTTAGSYPKDFDLTNLGYSSVFLDLPVTPSVPSPQPKSAAPNNASYSHIPIPPIPDSPHPVKPRRGLSHFRSLTTLTRSRSKSVSSMPSKPSKVQVANVPVTTRKKAQYKFVHAAPLANELALMQFADGGSIESHAKRVMAHQAKAAGPGVGVGAVFRDGEGGLWWDEDEEWEFAHLLSGEQQLVTNSEQTQWVQFEEGEERRGSVSTQDSDLDVRYLVQPADDEDMTNFVPLVLRRPGMSVLALPSRPRRAAKHLLKPEFIVDAAFTAPRSPTSTNSSQFITRRRPAPLKLGPLNHEDRHEFLAASFDPAPATAPLLSPLTPASAAPPHPKAKQSKLGMRALFRRRD